MTWTTRPRSELGSLSAIVAGKGAQILLIHGVGLRAEAWNAQISGLAEANRVIAIDMPGHGESAGLKPPVGLSDFVEAIAPSIERPTVVVGHSFGAMIALELAMRDPRHVVGVVALNAICRRSQDAKTSVLARANSLDGVNVPDPEGPLNRWFGSDLTPERTACDAWLRGIHPEGYRAAYHVFAQADGPTDADLNKLSCPALFLTGQNEPNSTPEMSDRMANLAPRGQARVIVGAAHMMPMTHPEIVLSELKRHARDCFL